MGKSTSHGKALKNWPETFGAAVAHFIWKHVHSNNVSECIEPGLSQTGVNKIDKQCNRKEGRVGTLAAVNSKGMSRLKEHMPGHI